MTKARNYHIHICFFDGPGRYYGDLEGAEGACFGHIDPGVGMNNDQLNDMLTLLKAPSEPQANFHDGNLSRFGQGFQAACFNIGSVVGVATWPGQGRVSEAVMDKVL